VCDVNELQHHPRNQSGDRAQDGPIPTAALALADAAVTVNGAVENIGARRLQTVMEKVLEEISFTAADRSGEAISIDADYVQARVGELAHNADLSRFIL